MDVIRHKIGVMQDNKIPQSRHVCKKRCSSASGWRYREIPGSPHDVCARICPKASRAYEGRMLGAPSGLPRYGGRGAGRNCAHLGAATNAVPALSGTTDEGHAPAVVTTALENLPHPWVVYSDFGFWLSFRREEHGHDYFCRCMLTAAKRFLDWNETRGTFRISSGAPIWEYFASRNSGLSEPFSTQAQMEVSSSFQPGLCHICNGRLPTRRHDGDFMFDRFYGWYVRWKLIEVTGDPFERDPGLRTAARRALSSQLGLKTRGILTREDILFLMVRSIFSDEPVVQRTRPTWLRGLELDILVPFRRFGIEYQGPQHFAPVDFFGGTKGHEATVRRDSGKRRFCRAAGIALEIFSDEDELTERWIRYRLRHYL